MFLSHVHETTLTVRNFRRLGVQDPCQQSENMERCRLMTCPAKRFIRSKIRPLPCARNVSFSSDRNLMTRLRIGSLSNYDDDDYENVT